MVLWSIVRKMKKLKWLYHVNWRSILSVWASVALYNLIHIVGKLGWKVEIKEKGIGLKTSGKWHFINVHLMKWISLFVIFKVNEEKEVSASVIVTFGVGELRCAFHLDFSWGNSLIRCMLWFTLVAESSFS